MYLVVHVDVLCKVVLAYDAVLVLHIMYVYSSESCVSEPAGEVTCVAGDVPLGLV